MSILERLEQMEQRMADITNHNQSSETTATKAAGMVGGVTDHQSQLSPEQGSFEGRVVVVCEKMMSRPCWVTSNQLVHSKSSRGMTLLHLAAAQGYAGLIQTLIRWRTMHADSLDLELEVDPLNVDHFSCTPLMWACALGHTEAAVLLYEWDPRALSIPDSLGRLPLSIARSRGHTRLAELLEQLQQAPATQGPPTDTWMDRWSGESQLRGLQDNPAQNPNSDLRRARAESQPGSQAQGPGWSQQGHRGSQDHQGDPPPAKRLKPNPESQQQTINTNSSHAGALHSNPPSHRDTQHPPSHRDAQHPPSHRDAQHPPSHRDAQHPPSHRDAQHPPSHRDTQHPPSHRDAQPPPSHRDAQHPPSHRDAQPPPSHRDAQHPPSHRDAQPPPSHRDAQPPPSHRPSPGPLFSHLQARFGEPGGGSRRSLRQALGRRSLARRILGKERLAGRLRQRALSERGEESDLLTYQENTEDLQMDMITLAEHIMEATPDRIKQENFVATETKTRPEKVEGSGDISLLAGFLGDVERFLYSRPQPPSPRSGPPCGPENQESPPAPQGPSLLSASLKEERLKADSSQLAMTESEQRELYETMRHALHTLRKVKGPIQEQRKEIEAVVQHCYKKYKQYALYKRMTLAAILIQSRFRTFHEQRKFQQSRRAAVLIQQYYRSYRHSLSSLLTKKQNQAARKILRFLLRCRHRAREQTKARDPEKLSSGPTYTPLTL